MPKKGEAKPDPKGPGFWSRQLGLWMFISGFFNSHVVGGQPSASFLALRHQLRFLWDPVGQFLSQVKSAVLLSLVRAGIISDAILDGPLIRAIIGSLGS